MAKTLQTPASDPAPTPSSSSSQAPARDLPPAADPLGETLHLLRLQGTFYCRSELTAPWGIDLPPFEGCMMFHIVTAGSCWLEVEGVEPRLVRAGSLVLIPHGQGHCMRSAPEAHADPLFDIPVEQVSDRYEIMRHGGGGEFAHVTCGVLRFDHVAARRLVALLPPVLQIGSWQEDSWHDEDDGWLQATLRLITREARELRPGGETVITRLADVLVIQAIRAWLESPEAADQGWLVALRDPQIGRALAALHRESEREWSLDTLAREVSMSRSAFSARFSELVGESAMRYLTRWRMQLAHSSLQEKPEPLASLAARLGYQSEAAFCRAFKREWGIPPGSVGRDMSATPLGVQK